MDRPEQFCFFIADSSGHYQCAEHARRNLHAGDYESERMCNITANKYRCGESIACGACCHSRYGMRKRKRGTYCVRSSCRWKLCVVHGSNRRHSHSGTKCIHVYDQQPDRDRYILCHDSIGGRMFGTNAHTCDRRVQQPDVNINVGERQHDLCWYHFIGRNTEHQSDRHQLPGLLQQ